jgi:hypothetical protein
VHWHHVSEKRNILVLQRTAAGESMSEAIVEESQRGYDAIFVGVSALDGEELLDDPVMLEVLRDSPAPMVIARSVAGGEVPFKRIIAAHYRSGILAPARRGCNALCAGD